MAHEEGESKSASWGLVTRIILLLAPTLIVCVIGLALAEGIARARTSAIAGSDMLDPGLCMYDPRLGWKLTPMWTGHHRQHDFDVIYNTNRLGFRSDSSNLTTVRHPWCAVIGDSFVFGFGVNDDKTFVHRLNDSLAPTVSYVNFGVPGYSTDQQLLLLEDQILEYKPDQILLVVYVGNDLFDNMRAYPIQVRRAKPYFVLSGGVLDLRNTPVPQVSPPVTDARQELRRAVLGEQDDSALDRIVSKSVLAGSLWERYSGESLSEAELRERFSPAMELFKQIVRRARQATLQHGATFTLAVLAGRSFVEAPKSSSSVYQQCLRETILEWAKASQIPTIDLAGELLRDHEKMGGDWYFENDGHLTNEGHAEVAKILARGLRIAAQ